MGSPIPEKLLNELIATLSLTDETVSRAVLCVALIELRELRRRIEQLREHWLIGWFMD